MDGIYFTSGRPKCSEPLKSDSINMRSGFEEGRCVVEGLVWIHTSQLDLIS